MSQPIQWLLQAFPPAPKWSPDDMPDLSGKVVLVTGGNSGIGFEMIKSLLRKNAKVYLAARSPQKAADAIRALKAETDGRTAEFLQLDLNDLAAVRTSAQEFAKREAHLDVLFLNAGIMFPPAPEQLTAQGHDATVGVNVVGHHLLLRLLHPLLLSRSSASQSQPGPARIVWVSSCAHYLVPGGRLDFSAFGTFADGPPARQNHKPRDAFATYCQSKLAQIQASALVARRAAEAEADEPQAVVSIAVDPGHIRSAIFRGTPASFFFKLWDTLVAYPAAYGALTPLYAGTAPEALAYNGKYLRAWARPGSPHPASYDRAQQEQLWSWLDEQVKDYL